MAMPKSNQYPCHPETLPASFTSAMLDYAKMRKAGSNTSNSAKAKGFGLMDYIKISIFGFALTALWSSLHTVIMPLRLLDFVPEALKNTYLDLLILTGLIIAMAVQPIAGAISDRSGFSWGRRRPYILLGTIMAIVFLPGIGLAGSYAAIFIIYCLLQISSNIAQGSHQGLIPDLVPEGKRGLASGARGLLNIVGGFAVIRLIAPLMDYYFAGERSSWLLLALGALAVVMLGAMLATILMVEEQPRTGTQPSLLPTLYKSFKIDVKARSDFIPFLAACFFIFIAWATVQGHILYYLMDVVGIAKPAELTGDLLIVVGVCMLAVVYPVGRLSDRVGHKPIAVSSGLLSALGIAALFFSRSYTHIMFCGGLLGICAGAWMSSQWALATDLVTKGEEARYLGLVNMSSAGAGALSRFIGPVIDFSNVLSPNLGYKVMLLVSFVCFVIGSALLTKIRGQD